MGEGSGVDIERKGSYPLVFNGLNSPTNPAVPDQHKYMVVIVPFIVVVNSVMFIVTMYANNCPRNSDAGGCIATFLGRFSFQPFSENPLLGPSSLTLEKMGALVTSKIENDNQGWRLITCIWIHAGVFHVLANMLSLLFIGIRFEQEFGFLRIGSVYLLSGFGGSLLSALFIQNRISVGASGALFGLLGAMVSELITNSTIYTNKRAALTVLILIVALNLAMGLLPHVDNFAHIGGFLSGFLLGFIFLIKPQYGWINPTKIPPRYEVGSPAKSKHRTYQYVLWISSLLLLIAGFTTAMVMVFHGYDANSHCRWCHYLSCVPTAKWSCHDSASCEVSKEFPFITPHK